MRKFIIFLAIFSSLILSDFLSAKHNILILNSYHQTLAWTDSLVKNIVDNLPDEEFYIEYMDTKRFPRKQVFKNFKNYLKEKYRYNKLDLVIVTDNNALEFTVNNKKTLFNKIPVLFCGINNFKKEMLKGFGDITGVVEGVDIKGTIDAILEIHKNVKNIIAIMGANYTSQLYYYRVIKLQPEYAEKVRIIILNGLFYGKRDLAQELKNLPPDTVILYLNLFKLKDGTIFGIKEGIEYIFQNTHKPIYLMWDVMMNFPGVVGGKVTSAYLQALSVVNFAKKILHDNVSVESLPVITKTPTEYIFDYNEIKRFKIDLSNFKEKYKFINKPPEVYEELEKKNTILIYHEIFAGILILLVVMLVYNIRRRKIMEDAIKSENLRFLTLLDSMQDVVVMKSPEGKWIYINKIAENFFKLEKSDYFGKTSEELLNKFPFKEKLKENYVEDYKVWEKGKVMRYIQTFEPYGGEIIYMDVMKIPVYNSDGTKRCIIAAGRDITQYQQLQNKLILAQKMEIIGRLAGGIAHDFNNILTVILNNAELCKMTCKNNEKVIKFIDNIIFSTERASFLVRHLLTFAKKEVESIADIELNTMVKSIVKIVKPLIPENITLSLSLCNMPVIIRADDVQIEQIVTNLLINARDAVIDSPKKDKNIKISINKVFLDEAYMKNSGKEAAPGEYALIAIDDNGKGIENSIKEKIYEPFFTTKNENKGTGLGLSTVVSLLEKNKGFLSLETEVEKGSVFRVYFPIVKAVKIQYAQQEEKYAEIFDKDFLFDKNVLFVEDNADILDTIPDFFKNKFKKFITAENGKNALDKIKKMEEAVDILITDIVMPVMDGIELAETLLKKNPRLKIIFVSGYDSGKLENIKFSYKFIYKPYKYETILKIVSEIF